MTDSDQDSSPGNGQFLGQNQGDIGLWGKQQTCCAGEIIQLTVGGTGTIQATAGDYGCERILLLQPRVANESEPQTGGWPTTWSAV